MTIMTRARAITGALFVALAGVLLTVPTARAQAQNAVITGRVTTEFGQPLEGANVYITEMNISVGSSADGRYTITIPAARVSGQQVVLRARSFGFVPVTRPLTVRGGSQTADFTLKQDVNRLQEVVVTGVTAGTEQKNLPFTVAHVDDKDIPVAGADPLQSLQGKVAGVTIAQTNGRPGASESILLRGPQSMNAQGRSQDPLYIVDGVEITPICSSSATGTCTTSLPDINPQDIESIEVVKGAAAASLYGSRAGNGVINITTKNGKASGEGIHFNARVEAGAGDIERQYPFERDNFLTMTPDGQNFCVKTSPNGSSLANCQIAINMGLEAARVNDLGGVFALQPANFERDGGIAGAPPKALLRGLFANNLWPVTYNPISQATTNAPSINSTVDASGQVGGANFFSSFNNFEQQSAFRYMDGYRRNSVRLNMDQNVGSDWSFGLRTYYAASVDNGSAEQDGGGMFFRLTRQPAGVNLLGTNPANGIFYIRSDVLQEGAQNQNPVYVAANEISRNNNSRFIGDFTSKFTPFSWANVEANVSIDRAQTAGLYEEDKGYRTTSASANPNNGYIDNSTNNNYSYNGDLTAALTHDFGKLATRLTGRYLYEQQDHEAIDANGSAFAAPGLVTLSDISDNTTVGLSSGQSSIRSIGMMSELSTVYNDRYILSGLVRRDGSSLFGADNRWADYYRASAAWIVSEEPWWGLHSIDNLKLRASYGTAGGRPAFADQYETFTIGTGGALSANQLGNVNLRPETVGETEVGIDAEILNKYGLTIDYAQSLATNQILPVPPSASTGFLTQWQNAGALQNKTWEVSLNVPMVRKRNGSWSMRWSYDRNRSLMTELNVPAFFGGVSEQGAGSIFRYAVGEEMGDFYGRKFATKCSDLPAPFAGQCGGAGSQFQKNSDGWIVWTGGQSLANGITNNLWQSGLVSCMKNGVPMATTGVAACTGQGGTVNSPWGSPVNWGTPIVIRDSTGTARQLFLGNALPRWRLSNAQNFNYKRVFLYALFDGSFGRKVWNEGQQWSYGDFQLAQTDQVGKSVADAKPIGYYFRTGPQESSGIGGLYDVLGPNNNSVEDASFVKIRELNLSYNIGAVHHTGDWTVSLIGRNLYTWTKYQGFDPETGYDGGNSGSAAINAVDAYTFPSMRTFTFAIATKF